MPRYSCVPLYQLFSDDDLFVVLNCSTQFNLNCKTSVYINKFLPSFHFLLLATLDFHNTACYVVYMYVTPGKRGKTS